jgi:hypothetical protein
MNVRLQCDLEFLAGIYYDDQLQMNQYDICLSLVTKTRDPVSTNIAMDRLKAFIYGELESTVFINQDQRERAELMQVMGINITTLPEEPVDQIIGMMLYYKLNAIMEDRMTVTQLDISSKIGDSIWYQHDEEDVAGPFAAEGWWHANTVQHNTVEVDPDETNTANVVKVVPSGWTEYGLVWPGEESTSENGNTVVFANFPKK